MLTYHIASCHKVIACHIALYTVITGLHVSSQLPRNFKHTEHAQFGMKPSETADLKLQQARPEPIKDKEVAETLQEDVKHQIDQENACLLYTSPSPRDRTRSRMPSSA